MTTITLSNDFASSDRNAGPGSAIGAWASRLDRTANVLGAIVLLAGFVAGPVMFIAQSV